MQFKLSRVFYFGIVVCFVMMTAGICSADEVNVNFVSHIGGAIYDAAVAGDYAYIGQGQDFVVLDISDKSNPIEVGKVTTLSIINGVAVSGGYAYVTDFENGLTIVNLNNPSSPIIAGNYNNLYTFDVAVSGDYVYLAGYNGFVVLDISTPSSPRYVGGYSYITSPANTVYDITVSGNYVYLAADWMGLLIVDVSNPSSPRLAGNYNTYSSVRHIDVSGNYSYLADYNDGLVILNTTNVSSPILVSEYNIYGADAVVVSDKYAYMAQSGLFTIVDISTPSSPKYVSNYSIGGDFVISGDYAYVAASSNGLVIMDIADPSSPAIEGTYDTDYAADIVLSGNYAYVPQGPSLSILNITIPSSPTIASRNDVFEDISDVAVSDNYAYVADRHRGLIIEDIRNPSMPNLVGSCDISGGAHSVDITDNYAYVIDGYTHLVVVDITTSSSPRIVGNCDLGYYGLEIGDVVGKYAYVFHRDMGLFIVDVTNPSSPTLVGSYNTAYNAHYVNDVTVSNDYAYIAYYANGATGLLVVNVTNPSSPILAGKFDDNYLANSVDVLDNYAYIASHQKGLTIVDITDPSSPTVAGSYDTAGISVGVAVSDDYVYVADERNGLVILKTYIMAQDLTGGSLVQVEGSPEVYLLKNGIKRHFTSPEALEWNGYNFSNIAAVSSELLQKYPDGKDISISQPIIDKYNSLGGASFFGAPKGDGELIGKPDQDGNYCSYVNFEKGAIECFTNGPNVGKAYAIVDQFYTKWASMGYGKSVLGYPIGDMSEERTSSKNTPYKYQLFTNGTQLGALEWNLNTNQVFEVHGAIFAKWAEVGFASSVLGLPTGDEQNIASSKYGTIGRYGTFENGHIHWNKATGLSFVTYGALNECYNNIQGTQSDLGFPIMSQVGTTDGHYYCEFEKGCIEWNANSGKYEPNFSPNINQRIDAKLKAKPNFPQYLLDPDYVGSVTVVSLEFADRILDFFYSDNADLREQYDKLYNDGIKYYNIRNCYLYNAKQSLKNNDITGAEKFLERADKMQTCSYNSFQAANDVFVGSTESAEILAEGVRKESELICNIGIGFAPYSSLTILGQSVKCKDAMFYTFLCVDMCKEWKINGLGEGVKQGVITVAVNHITSGIKFKTLGGKTLDHALVENSIDISQPAVSKQIHIEIVDNLMTPNVQKTLFENGFHGTAIGAGDAAAMYFTEEELSKVIDYLIENICHMIDVPIETVQSYSPVELRVYDSTGRVTGLVDGIVKNEIPNSIYEPELEKVFIYMANDTYRYETIGTANATYGLKMVHYENMTDQEIVLKDVPVTINAKHVYHVDWENESQVNKTVTINEDFVSPRSISNIQSTNGTTWLNFTWTNPTNPDFNHTEIYLNGIFQTNTSSEYFNASGLQPNTNYTISTQTVDIYGNVNQTWVNLTVRTKPLANDWNPWNDSGSDGGESITLSELQQAIYDWRFGIPASTGETVDLTRLQQLIYSWRVG